MVPVVHSFSLSGLASGVRKFSNQNATAHKRQAFEANDHEHNPEKHRAMWQNVSFGMIALSGVLTAVTFKNHFAHAGHEKHEPVRVGARRMCALCLPLRTRSSLWRCVGIAVGGTFSLAAVFTPISLSCHWQPAYEYRDIKNKQFPWGAESLFTAKK